MADSVTLATAGDFINVVAVWDSDAGSGSWEIVACGKSATFATTPAVTALTAVQFA